jgi:hypothetical protein
MGENHTRPGRIRPKQDTNLKLARFPARSLLPVAALPSVSLIPQLHSRLTRIDSCLRGS